MPTNPVTTRHDFMRMLERHIVFSNFFSKFVVKGFLKIWSLCEYEPVGKLWRRNSCFKISARKQNAEHIFESKV